MDYTPNNGHLLKKNPLFVVFVPIISLRFLHNPGRQSKVNRTEPQRDIDCSAQFLAGGGWVGAPPANARGKRPPVVESNGFKKVLDYSHQHLILNDKGEKLMPKHTIRGGILMNKMEMIQEMARRIQADDSLAVSEWRGTFEFVDGELAASELENLNKIEIEEMPEMPEGKMTAVEMLVVSTANCYATTLH